MTIGGAKVDIAWKIHLCGSFLAAIRNNHNCSKPERERRWWKPRPSQPICQHDSQLTSHSGSRRSSLLSNSSTTTSSLRIWAELVSAISSKGKCTPAKLAAGMNENRKEFSILRCSTFFIIVQPLFFMCKCINKETLNQYCWNLKTFGNTMYLHCNNNVITSND